jgi:hypothetical protein
MADLRSADRSTFSFTDTVLELEDAGYDSMGFAIEDGDVCCLECDRLNEPSAVGVGGVVRYASGAGEGHLFPLSCPSCGAKGLLFAGPELLAGGAGDTVRLLAARARTGARSSG